MNADFEMELASRAGRYLRPASFEKINRRLTAHLLWLARRGDALLLDEPFPQNVCDESARRGVELVSLERASDERARIFTPWGWTESALKIGERVGTTLPQISLATVARVNSKLWSHALEQELGLALKDARACATFEELSDATRRACPKPDDKWVIKSPFGFAARERVLGRGPVLDGAQATWCGRQFAKGETLIFQPWLEVRREYGIVLNVLSNGESEMLGISDLQTNGAGTGTGYLLGRPVERHRVRELEQVAKIVGERLSREGYIGPAGFDALEHAKGLHPLLEINARYTMGFVALEVERALQPVEPMFWSMRVITVG
jgi:hypothetical protein